MQVNASVLPSALVKSSSVAPHQFSSDQESSYRAPTLLTFSMPVSHSNGLHAENDPPSNDVSPAFEQSESSKIAPPQCECCENSRHFEETELGCEIPRNSKNICFAPESVRLADANSKVDSPAPVCRFESLAAASSSSPTPSRKPPPASSPPGMASINMMHVTPLL